MSDTFVTASPHWTWFIIPYFFVGGIAGGAYFLAAALEWFGRPADRPVIRTEFDTVVIQSDVCNGCRACIAACPFGVIDLNAISGTAQKCTLCYDRWGAGLEPACSKACPTDSIQFGPISELRARANKRVAQLQAQGEKRAQLYGDDPNGPLGGLNSFYLLVDNPEVYGLPANPQLPTRTLTKSGVMSAATAAVLGVLALVGIRKRRMDEKEGATIDV